MDTAPLAGAYRTLLEAARAVAAAGGPAPVPPDGEWDADRILAHVAVLTAITLETVSTVASGGNAGYDNRRALDEWNLGRTIERAGGGPGLRERLGHQADALCSLSRPLAEAELDTQVPTLLLSHGALILDRPMSLRDLLTGLAGVELPGHTDQLLALLPRKAGARAAG